MKNECNEKCNEIEIGRAYNGPDKKAFINR